MDYFSFSMPIFEVNNRKKTTINDEMAVFMTKPQEKLELNEFFINSSVARNAIFK